MISDNVNIEGFAELYGLRRAPGESKEQLRERLLTLLTGGAGEDSNVIEGDYRDITDVRLLESK